MLCAEMPHMYTLVHTYIHTHMLMASLPHGTYIHAYMLMASLPHAVGSVGRANQFEPLGLDTIPLSHSSVRKYE